MPINTIGGNAAKTRPAALPLKHEGEEKDMKRRDFMTKAGLGGVATATALATPAIAQDRIEIAMVSTWPRDFPGLGTGAQRFAKRLGDVSDGRIQVTYYAADKFKF